MDFTDYSYDLRKEGKDFYLGLFSDLHCDSRNFAKAAFIEDIERCIAKGARILFNGDTFDAIVSTDLKRYTRGKDQFDEDAQLNVRIEYALDLLKPYVNSIDFMGIGNHEASIIRYDHVDLVKMLVRELNLIRDPKLPPIKRGGYQGFLRFTFRDNVANYAFVYDIYREHGKGGASPVTKGTININRIHTTFVADLYWLGHSHTDIVDKTSWTIYPSVGGKRIIKKRKYTVITAGYQDTFIQRDLGNDKSFQNDFAEEKFLVPTGIGSALVHLSFNRAGHDHELLIRTEIIS